MMIGLDEIAMSTNDTASRTVKMIALRRTSLLLKTAAAIANARLVAVPRE
jgi:hypothetical protein